MERQRWKRKQKGERRRERRQHEENTEKEQVITEKEKAKASNGACWTCNEIGHRAEDCPKKKTDLNPIGDGLEQDHDWEEDRFGDEDYWTVGSLQAVLQSPPGLHLRGGCTTTPLRPKGPFPREGAREAQRGAPKPTVTNNRWRVIAPDDDDEDYEPNDKAKDADYPLPTSDIPIKRGKKG